MTALKNILCHLAAWPFAFIGFCATIYIDAQTPGFLLWCALMMTILLVTAKRPLLGNSGRSD